MTAHDTAAERLLRSALTAAARGWHVFPVAPGAKVPALRGDWRDLATSDADRICSWWARRAYNIGISCGPSGLVVIDLDLPHAGEPAQAAGAQTLASLCRERGEPYPCGTFTVHTPSGGTHLYFTATGTAVPNSADTLGRHIDIRAAGGYVIAPGSRIAGRAYHAHDANAQPSLLPGWIATALAEHRAESRTLLPAACMPHAEPDRRAVAYAMAALRGEALRVAGAREGTRNDVLNRAAFALGQLVASGLLPELSVVTALAEAAAQAGLPEREARRTIRSGMTAGSRQPRSGPGRERPPSPPALLVSMPTTLGDAQQGRSSTSARPRASSFYALHVGRCVARASGGSLRRSGLSFYAFEFGRCIACPTVLVPGGRVRQLVSMPLDVGLCVAGSYGSNITERGCTCWFQCLCCRA